jgi:hypothetical protein
VRRKCILVSSINIVARRGFGQRPSFSSALSSALVGKSPELTDHRASYRLR